MIRALAVPIAAAATFGFFYGLTFLPSLTGLSSLELIGYGFGGFMIAAGMRFAMLFRGPDFLGIRWTAVFLFAFFGGFFCWLTYAMTMNNSYYQ